MHGVGRSADRADARLFPRFGPGFWPGLGLHGTGDVLHGTVHWLPRRTRFCRGTALRGELWRALRSAIRFTIQNALRNEFQSRVPTAVWWSAPIPPAPFLLVFFASLLRIRRL